MESFTAAAPDGDDCGIYVETVAADAAARAWGLVLILVVAAGSSAVLT